MKKLHFPGGLNLKTHTKANNFGILIDIALENHRKTFALQTAFMGLINVVFICFTFILGVVGLFVIWPAIPNFTGNAIINDGIFLGIFSIVTLFVIMFFLMWQSVAAIIVCKYRDSEDLQSIIKAILKASLSALTVLFALTFAFAPFLVAVALVAAFNLSAFMNLAPILGLGLFIIFIVIRTLSFFALNLSLSGNGHFLSALANSTKMVFQRGAIRIFAVVTLITMLNLGLFIGLLLVLLVLFGQYPADFLGFLEILDNPMGILALLFLAYIITAFLTPKLQILAYTIYNSHNTPRQHDRAAPGLASRALATVLDIAICAVFFAAFFYGAAMLFSGGGFVVSQLNMAAVIITIIAFLVVFTIYNIYFEVFEGGQTPAKHLCGLVVLSQDSERLGLAQSLVRNTLRIVDIFGFVAIIFNKEHRRLGDMLSLTIVKYKEN